MATGIEPAILQPGNDLAGHRAWITTLAETLVTHGHFTYSAGDRSVMAEIARSLSDHENRKLVIELLHKLSRYPIQVPGDRLLTDLVLDGPVPVGLPDKLLIVLSREAYSKYATAAGHGDEIAYQPTDGLEITRYDCVSQAQYLTKLRAAAQRPLESGSTRESVWSTRLRPLFVASTRVDLFDRYLRSDARNGIHGRPSGADWLFDSLAQLRERSGAGPWNLSLYTAADTHSDGGAAVRDISEVGAALKESGGSAIQSLKIVWVDDRRFGRFGHDRFWRFGDRWVIEYGQSINLFSKPALRKRCGWSFHAALHRSNLDPFESDILECQDEARRPPTDYASGGIWTSE